MKLTKILSACILIIVLTALSQIGGLVFLISLLTYRFIDRKINRNWLRAIGRITSFVILYLIFTFLIVPLIAKPLGRVPLPLFEKNHVRPATIWTCLLNRHYVRPKLREIMFKVGKQMNTDFPGTVINYLDANFPFLNKFPLPPHLSHNDGRKLDVSFLYLDSRSGKQTTDIPSFIGYGVCEEPRQGEENKPDDCAQKGYWQYSLLKKALSQDNKSKFTFDNERTKMLVNNFAYQGQIGKIFIEPHLKTRLGLTSNKIRFHGCQAVRHDDHIHVQLN